MLACQSGFGLVSLGLEQILDNLVPKTISVGRNDLDYFEVGVVSLGQILDNLVPKTVSVGRLNLD